MLRQMDTGTFFSICFILASGAHAIDLKQMARRPEAGRGFVGRTLAQWAAQPAGVKLDTTVGELPCPATACAHEVMVAIADEGVVSAR